MKRKCYCKWKLVSTDRSSAIAELLEYIPEIDSRPRDLLLTALLSREQAGATIVHPSISMPHCRSILVDDFLIVLGRSDEGVAWPDQNVGLVILFISPVKPGGPEEHTELIKQIAGSIRDGGSDKLFEASDPEELADLLGLELIDSEVDE